MPDELQTDLLSQAIVATMTQPLLVLGEDLRVRLANRAFYETFRLIHPRLSAASCTNWATDSGISPRCVAS
jgi:hypothetical protein